MKINGYSKMIFFPGHIFFLIIIACDWFRHETIIPDDQDDIFLSFIHAQQEHQSPQAVTCCLKQDV